MHFDSCHVYIFYIQLFQKRIKIKINILQRKSKRLQVWIFNI